MKSTNAQKSPWLDRNISTGGAPNRVPTVLQLLPSLEVGGGVARGTLEISRALSDEGWRSIIMSAGSNDKVSANRAGAVHSSLPVGDKNPLRALFTIRKLIQVIEAEKVDLVHARSRAPAWLAHYATRRTKRPLITTFHGTYSTTGPFKHRYNAIMTTGTRVIAISNFIATHLSENYPIDPAIVRVIPRGVDLSVFDPLKVGSERTVTLAHNWRVPTKSQVVLMPARLTDWKGQTVLIEALARIRDEGIYCVMVGGHTDSRSRYRQRLTRQIERLGVGHMVHLAGDCNDMPAAYMLADIVVSASTRPEAFGRVIVEAQAMGRPVIATDHGGACETVYPNKTGWLVRPGDDDALQQALVEALATSIAQRRQMALDCRKHVRRNFNMLDMCSSTLSVYREVLPHHRTMP